MGRLLQRCAISLALTLSTLSGATQIQYGSRDFARLIAYAPSPAYPQKAWDMHWTGRGIFRLHIRRDNLEVSEIKIVKSTGHHVLDSAALLALVKWKFKPGAPEFVEVPLDFQL